MIWKGMTFELPGKTYDTPEYIMNIINKSTSKENQNFKEAFTNRQRTLGDKSSSYDTDETKYKKFTEKAIEILEEQFNNDKQKVTMVMKYIINQDKKNNPKKTKITVEFNYYMNDYAQYIKKIS